jgi:type IX secretion system PorP/SprF family membrane protein
MKKFYIIIIVVLSVQNYANAQQDAMFTRYTFINNMHYNPAVTGRYEGLRSSIAYRKQWANVPGAPSTIALGIEKNISDKSGLGLNVFNDKIGFDAHTGIHINYAYKIPVSQSYTLALGLKAGASILNSDFTKAITPQPGQIEPIHTNPYHKFVPRAGVGLLLTNNKSYLGFSMPNVISWLDNDIITQDNDAYLSKHFYASIGHVIGNEVEDIQFKPSVFVKYHPSAPLQIDVNVMAWYKNRIAAGLSYRTGDAISGIVEIAITPTILMSYAYDYTASDFRRIGHGAHEIIICHTFIPTLIKVPSIHKFSTMTKI